MTQEPVAVAKHVGHLYHFLDSDSDYQLIFVDGKELMANVATRPNLGMGAFIMVREVLLQLLPLMGLIKTNETRGLYIDGEGITFKLEFSTSGYLRFAVHPRHLAKAPDTIRGQARMTRYDHRTQHHYTSVIALENVPLSDIATQFLKISDQVDGCVFVSKYADHSLLVQRLPRGQMTYKGKKPPKAAQRSLDEYIASLDLSALIDPAYVDQAAVESAFTKKKYEFLMHQDLSIHCSCSKDYMIMRLSSLMMADPEFMKDESENKVMTVTCDYCDKQYEIEKSDLEQKAIN